MDRLLQDQEAGLELSSFPVAVVKFLARVTMAVIQESRGRNWLSF